jgi:hypothetical protein
MPIVIPEVMFASPSTHRFATGAFGQREKQRASRPPRQFALRSLRDSAAAGRSRGRGRHATRRQRYPEGFADVQLTWRCLMSPEIRDLSDAEVDTVAGGVMAPLDPVTGRFDPTKDCIYPDPDFPILSGDDEGKLSPLP